MKHVFLYSYSYINLWNTRSSLTFPTTARTRIYCNKNYAYPPTRAPQLEKALFIILLGQFEENYVLTIPLFAFLR